MDKNNLPMEIRIDSRLDRGFINLASYPLLLSFKDLSYIESMKNKEIQIVIVNSKKK